MNTDIILFDGNNEFGFDKTLFLKMDSKNILKIKEGKGFKENRKILERGKIDILLDPHKNILTDSYHYRKSGLNQVLCKIAKEKDIAMGISFNSILQSKNRAKELGKIMQNIRFCRKYKIKIVFGSFAKKYAEMRSYNDLLSFAKTLGMSDKEAKKCFQNVQIIISDKKIKYLSKGVKLIE